MVEIDYVDTIRKAGQLEALADELENISAKDLESVKSGVSAAWKGTAAELYIKKTNEFSQKIKTQAKDLQKQAGRLRKTAEDYQKLERMAQNIFSNGK